MSDEALLLQPPPPTALPEDLLVRVETMCGLVRLVAVRAGIVIYVPAFELTIEKLEKLTRGDC